MLKNINKELRKELSFKNRISNIIGDIIVINQFTIYIQNSKEELIFDLQALRETIDQLLPNYLIYRIVLNNNSLIENNSSNTEYQLKENYTIGKNIHLLAKIGIKQNSAYYFKNINEIYKKLFLSVIVSSIVISIILYIYLRYRNNHFLQIQRLNNKLYEIDKENQALLLSIQASKELKEFFIQKSNTEYLKQHLYLEDDNILSIDQTRNNYCLFPICFNGFSEEEIKLEELIINIKNYFAKHSTYITMIFEKKLEKLKITCTHHVFVQLIFSLINNIFIFIDDQSNTPKVLLVIFEETKLIISYDSFPLTEQSMINLSDNIYSQNIDVFLLGCRKIFESLKRHELGYKISNSNNKNIIEIMLKQPVVRKPTDNKIIKLAKYQK
ncbi:MAG TPA: hypothetical protein LFW20_01200 [Rickettsia endosymbiont of Omalisus fontisbellaquei]|nr:hypothetical protein [Rickettsia endosymbiont of Omalisus fontisbellaquei]